MMLKKIAFALCLLCAFIICSCGPLALDVEYTFDNKSSYTIQITLSEPYATSKPSENYTPSKTSSSFYVYRDSKKTVYVDNANVNFQWATSSLQNMPEVYCSVNGSTATFRDN